MTGHGYLSSRCHHDLHDQCPGRCFCGDRCVCVCHTPEDKQ